MKYIKITPIAKEQTVTMKTKRKWLWEFSKKIVVTVTVVFVAVYLFSCILLCLYPDSTALQSVIDNISDIFKVTVVSYAVKAGFENIFKIKKTASAEELSDEPEEENDDEEIYINPREGDG